MVACGAYRVTMKTMITRPSPTIAVLGILFTSIAAHAATLEVDKDRSRIQVDAKATGHAFTGDLKNYTIAAGGDSVTNKPTALSLSWDFNDLKTADGKRDKAMIDWLGGGKPNGAFTLAKTWDETPTGGKAEGTLTINGVAKKVSFPYTVKREGEWVTLNGKVSLDYQNFKLPIIRSMAVMTVDPKLVIRFHVVGTVK
jgi:polyisoprenoid-binding protein YceI